MKYQENNICKEMVLKGKVLYLIMIFSLLVTCVNAYTVYTCNVASGAWATAGTWNPTRTTPAADDVLVFDGNVLVAKQCSLTGVPTQTIGQLQVVNGCTATFQASAVAFLSIGTTEIANPAFFVDTNSQLILYGNKSITLVLQPYSVGTVNGDVVFAGTAAAGGMQFSVQTAGGLVFTNGGTLQNAPTATVTLAPFGATAGVNNISVVFDSGATYYQSGTKSGPSGGSTGNPFGLTQPASAVVFQPGSYYWAYELASFSTFDVRTVGNLILDNRGATVNIAGNTGAIVIQNDFVCESTQTGLVYSRHGAGGWLIKGNFIVQAGSAGFNDQYGNNIKNTPFEVLGNFSCAGTFVPDTGGAVTFPFSLNRLYILDGSSPQTLMLNTNSLPLSNLSVNNVSGINILSNVAIVSTLYMGAGNINTNGYTLTLGSSYNNLGTLSRNVINPWIIGNFQRWIPSGSPVAYEFPVGAANYDGATIDFTGSAPSGSGFITVSFTTINPGGNSISLGPDSSGNIYYDVASSGYWTINNGATLSGNPNLWLAVNDIAGLPSPITEDGIVESSVVYPSTPAWTITGSSPSNNSGTLIESAGLALPSGASYYDIASPTTNFSPPVAGFYATPLNGNGPLPVYFFDTSANSPASWNWTFGDGSTGILKNPAHTYGALAYPTTYTVGLIVNNAYGSSTATYLNYISVGTAAGPLSSGVIWNWDTLSPATVLHQGYLYVYGYTNTKGIGGSNSLEIDVPYKGVGVRGKGEGLWMSNYAGFSLNSVSPYNGTIGNNLGNLNLSTNPYVYFSIIASNTSSFGVSFAMYDTTGKFFIPNGNTYLSDSIFFQNSISSTAFQKVIFNMANTHAYKAGHTTGTAPVLTNIEAFELFFPCVNTAPSGQGSVPSELKFFIDDVGAGTVPVELSNFEALESFIKKY